MKLMKFLSAFEDAFNLTEFVNIESGYLGISGIQIRSQCEYCSLEIALNPSCNSCGMAPDNFVRVRAGDGDGVYPVFQSWSNRAGAIWFDQSYSLKERAWALPERGPGVEPRLDKNLGHLLENEVYKLGEIVAPTQSTLWEDQALIGLADASADPSDAIAVISAGSSGNVSVFSILDRASDEGYRGPAPRLVFAVETEFITRLFGPDRSSIRDLPAEVSAAWPEMLVQSNLISHGREWAHFQNYARRDSIARIFFDSQNLNEATAINIMKHSTASIYAVKALQKMNSDLAHQLLTIVAADYGLDEDSDVALEVREEWLDLMGSHFEATGLGQDFFDTQLTDTEWTRTIRQKQAASDQKPIASSHKEARTEAQPAVSISSELEKLSTLYSEGLLTKEEFALAKSKLLGTN